MDHEMDAASARQMESHLRQCADCRETLNELQEIDIMVSGLPEITADTDFSAQMVRIVNKTRHQGRLSLSERISRIVREFADMLGSVGSPSTGILDEFSDFPPLSIGQIYFRLTDMPARLSW
ncbi:MAG: zf-HC2 domain-containing protein [Desulfobacteraceae bacterium]|nr:zf-HC2 domain-containing protein [Desulfobacteraceae bacterium]